MTLEDLIELALNVHPCVLENCETCIDMVLEEIKKIKVPYTVDFDTSWGICVSIKGQYQEARSLALACHMDSDNVTYKALKSIQWKESNQKMEWNPTLGDVGLDCKTGVAMILFIAQNMNEQPMRDTHFIFSISEENGQRGVISMPINVINKLQDVICIDRKTCGKDAPVIGNHTTVRGKSNPLRHMVTEYCGITTAFITSELVQNIQNEFLNVGEFVECVASPNCADSLEYKIRFDCEVYALDMISSNEKLHSLLTDFNESTSEMNKLFHTFHRQGKRLGFKHPARQERYKAYLSVYEEMKKYAETESLEAVNLSYNYDEKMGSLDIAELMTTCNVMMSLLYKNPIPQQEKADNIWRSETMIKTIYDKGKHLEKMENLQQIENEIEKYANEDEIEALFWGGDKSPLLSKEGVNGYRFYYNDFTYEYELQLRTTDDKWATFMDEQNCTGIEDKRMTDECAICYDQISSSDLLAQPALCKTGHVFHASCLKKWNSEYKKCPICRVNEPAEISVGTVWEIATNTDGLQKINPSDKFVEKLLNNKRYFTIRELDFDIQSNSYVEAGGKIFRPRIQDSPKFECPVYRSAHMKTKGAKRIFNRNVILTSSIPTDSGSIEKQEQWKTEVLNPMYKTKDKIVILACITAPFFHINGSIYKNFSENKKAKWSTRMENMLTLQLFSQSFGQLSRLYSTYSRDGTGNDVIVLPMHLVYFDCLTTKNIDKDILDQLDQLKTKKNKPIKTAIMNLIQEAAWKWGDKHNTELSQSEVLKLMYSDIEVIQDKFEEKYKSRVHDFAKQIAKTVKMIGPMKQKSNMISEEFQLLCPGYQKYYIGSLEQDEYIVFVIHGRTVKLISSESVFFEGNIDWSADGMQDWDLYKEDIRGSIPTKAFDPVELEKIKDDVKPYKVKKLRNGKMIFFQTGSKTSKPKTVRFTNIQEMKDLRPSTHDCIRAIESIFSNGAYGNKSLKPDMLCCFGGETHWLNSRMWMSGWHYLLNRPPASMKDLVLTGASAGMINTGISTCLASYKGFSTHWYAQDQDLQARTSTMDDLLVATRKKNMYTTCIPPDNKEYWTDLIIPLKHCVFDAANWFPGLIVPHIQTCRDYESFAAELFNADYTIPNTICMLNKNDTQQLRLPIVIIDDFTEIGVVGPLFNSINDIKWFEIENTRETDKKHHGHNFQKMKAFTRDFWNKQMSFINSKNVQLSNFASNSTYVV